MTSAVPVSWRGTVRVTELDKQPYIQRMNCELWGVQQDSQVIELFRTFAASYDWR